MNKNNDGPSAHRIGILIQVCSYVNTNAFGCFCLFDAVVVFVLCLLGFVLFRKRFRAFSYGFCWWFHGKSFGRNAYSFVYWHIQMQFLPHSLSLSCIHIFIYPSYVRNFSVSIQFVCASYLPVAQRCFFLYFPIKSIWLKCFELDKKKRMEESWSIKLN